MYARNKEEHTGVSSEISHCVRASFLSLGTKIVVAHSNDSDPPPLCISSPFCARDRCRTLCLHPLLNAEAEHHRRHACI